MLRRKGSKRNEKQEVGGGLGPTVEGKQQLSTHQARLRGASQQDMTGAE